MTMSVVSTLSGRPVSAKRMSLTDQAALDREVRQIKENNNNPNLNSLIPRPLSNSSLNRNNKN